MLVDWQFLMHNFCAVMNGGAVAFWEDQSEANLALIMALTALDQEEPNMSWPAGCVHVFVWKTGDYSFLIQMQNLAHHSTGFHCHVCWTDFVRIWAHSTEQSSMTCEVIVYPEPLPLCGPVTLVSHQQPATPCMWPDKTGQHLMHALLCTLDCECVCKNT